MNLNNKGITLIEIIISVALISIVLIFLMNLFIEMNRINKTNEIKTSYLLAQTTFTKQISEDFYKYGYSNWEGCNVYSNLKDGKTDENILYLPNTGWLLNDIESKCLKFKFNDPNNSFAYLFLYKSKKHKNVILSYYRGKDFKQSVELIDYRKDMNTIDGYFKRLTPTSSISKVPYSFININFPIIGPDGNDYSINIAYDFGII